MALRYPDRPIDLAVALGAVPGDYEDHDADELVTHCIVDGHEDANPSLVVGRATQVPRRRLFAHCRVCNSSRIAATLERLEIDLGKPPAGARLWRHDDNDGDNDDDEGGDDGSSGDEQDADQKHRAEEDRQKTQAQLSAVHAIWEGGVPYGRGDEAWQYLTQHRGLPDGGPWEPALVVGDVLRTATNVLFPSKDCDRQLNFPLVMLARITTASGRTIGYQLSPLDPKTLALIKPRLTIGSLKGGAIRIAGGGPEAMPALVLAEGLETGLSRLAVGDRVELRICCGGIDTTGQELAVSWAKARLAEPDLPSPAWAAFSRIELLVDRDKEAACRELARALNGAGLVEVRQVKADGQSTRNADLNDVLRAGGVEGVRAAIDGAERMARGFGVLVNPKDLAFAARDIAHYSLFDALDRPWLILTAQNNYLWDDEAMLWRVVPDEFVNNFVSTILLRSCALRVRGGKVVRFDRTTTEFARKLAKAVQSEALVADFTGSAGKTLKVTVEPIGRKLVFSDVGPYLPLRDGWLVSAEIIELAERRGPEIFTTSAIPVTLRELRAQEPKLFLRLLREAFSANDGWTKRDVNTEIDRTFEVLGLAIDGDRLGQQRIVVLLGSGGTGKSTVTEALERLLGPAFASIQIRSLLHNSFVFQQAIDAKVIVMPDVRALSHARSGQVNAVLGMLLAISGGDSILVDKKYKPAVSARLTSALWLVANTWPSALNDSFGALNRRLEFLHFARDPARKDDDPTLRQSILKHELGGILRLALAGLNRLYATGEFTTSAQSRSSKQEQMLSVDPISEFADYFDGDAKAYLLRADVYRAYRQHCGDEGSRPKFFRDFFSDLQAALRSRDIRIRERKVRGQRRISGIRWSEQTPDEVRKGPLSCGEDDD